MTQPLKQRMAESAAVIRKQLGCESLPATLVVLGSGFKGFESELSEAKSVDLSAVVHCPVPKVEGHGATLVIGQLKSSVAVLTGRVHLYEGYDAGQVVYVLRVLATMGVQRVLLTNAAGSLDLNIKPGQVVVLSDHINCTGQNCLVGEARELGPIFIDMSSCYDKQWRRQIMATDILPLVEGVYAGVLGPNYETPSETKMLGALGAQVAGMSTVQEAIAVHQLGVKVAALSFVTNMAGGLGKGLNHAEVLALAEKHKIPLKNLLKAAIAC